jgi:hypothetical protein
VSLVSIRDTASVDPWFRRRPRLALGVAAALFAAVLALRLTVGTPLDAYSMLYVFPVALVAIVFGLRGGIMAGLVAVSLMVVWAAVQDVSLSPAGWLSRMLPMLLLGALLGEATDRLRQAEAERRRWARASLLHRDAIEINDSIVQGMAAAKWSLEMGRIDDGLATLDETITRAQGLVSGLIREAEMGGRTERLGERAPAGVPGTTRDTVA